jgi:hypothetical protein
MKIKQIITLTVLAIAFSNSVFSQVGIGTTTPKATLDVTGTPATATTADGIIAPRLTGNELAAKDAVYLAAHTGTQVYVTAAATTPAGKTINVTAAGYYYFDGTVWKAFGSAASGLVIKRVAMNTLTAGANGLYTITDTDLPSSASLPILVSYEDEAGTVTAVNLSNRAAGVFSVTLAATAGNTGFLNYAYPSANVTVVAGTTGATGPAGATGASGATGAAGPAGPAGANGSNGAAATVAVGTVTALAAGATPTVTNTGTSAAAALNFGIPSGATGPAGPAGANGSNGAAGAAATVAVGTVTALAAGATPTVTNSGTAAAATLNFGIPTSIPVYKGTQATDGTNASFIIANSNITATSVVTVSYFNSSNEIISHAISAIAAGSFTVQFAAVPANGGSILYTIVN